MEKIKNNTKNLGPNSLISDVGKVYLKLMRMEELVFVSSITWILWFIIKVFPKQEGTATIILVLFFGVGLMYVIINFSKKRKLRDTDRWRKSFMRPINFPGSILFLFLFLNSFLKISEPINQEFLGLVEGLEKTYSTTLFSGFLAFVFIFSIICLFRIFERIKIGGIARREAFWEEIILIALIIIFFVLFISGKFETPFFAALALFILKWFFGLSLVSLHLNYLIKEIKNVLKVRPARVGT